MSRFTIAAISIIAAMSFVTAVSASPGGSDYAMSASPQSMFVSPGENATIRWLAWNNTDEAASCDVSVGDVTVFAGVIQADSTEAGQFSTPVLDRNSRFTFLLTCNGLAVASRSVNIKVR